VSGMEVPLSSFLVVGGAAWLLEDHAGGRPPYRGLAVLAIACLARPENTVIFLVAAGAAIAWGRSPRGMLRRFLIAVALLAVVVGPWIGFNYHSHGRPLPTTFYAKSGAGIVRALDASDTAMAKRAVVTHGAGGIRGFVQTVRAQLPVVGLLALLGAVLCFSRRGTPGRWWIPVALLVVPVAMGAVAPQRVKPDNVRYTAQLVSIVAVLAAAGLWELVKRLPRRLRLASVAAALGWLLFSGAGRPAEYGLAVRNINELHVAMGRWVARHIPPGATVAANDVGAIAYFGRRRVLDLEGLVSPRSLRYRDGAPDRGLRIVEAERPDFLVISPSWYPDITGKPARFVEAYRITISDNVAAGDASLVVLSTPWTPYRLAALERPHAGGS
jgi:hypothetical protein